MTTLKAGSIWSFLDDLGELFFVFDETGTVLEWNRPVVDVTGRSADELAETTLADCFEGPEQARVLDAVATAFETGEASVVAELSTADGTRVPYEFEAYRLPDEAGEPTRFGAIGRRVEQRGPADDESREALDRMSDAFFAVDADWQLTFVNDVGAEILSRATADGLEPDELEGSQLWEEIPDAVGTSFYEKYHEAMETQTPVTFEEYYEPLDTWFDVRAFPSETGLSVYFYDVTDRHHQQAELEKREQVLREMHDIIADRGQPFTDQVEALLRLGREELGVAYGSLSQIRGEDYVFEVVDAADDGVQAGDVVPLSATNCEIAASTKQTLVLADVARDAPEQTHRAGYTDWGVSCYIGAPVYVEDDVYGTFCFYDTHPREGRFSEWEVTLVDLMSRWVSYELERQHANRRLRRQNEKLDHFASLVSHDLRNPISVLMGSLELAEETGDPEHFERCHRAVERMNALVDDILSLSRAGDTISTVESVDLASASEQAWEIVATEWATLNVTTEQVLEGDASRLQQLLENLFRNAVEHGGESVTVGDLDDGFYVEDDGPGIPGENLEQVFESGYSTNAEGTGFGLAIVQEIAEAHGWRVAAVDTEGGARFEFTGARR